MRYALAILALMAGTMPAAAISLSPSDLARGAAMIRAHGYPCERITRVSRVSRSVYRVSCGRHAYRVTVGRFGGLSLSLA
jgi:hypothetical protein